MLQIPRITSKSFSLFHLHIKEHLHRMVTIMLQHTAGGTESMLRITTEKKRGKTILSVEGRLAGPSVATLEPCWRELRPSSPQEKFHVKLFARRFIHAAGKKQLKENHPQRSEPLPPDRLNQAL